MTDFDVGAVTYSDRSVAANARDAAIEMELSGEERFFEFLKTFSWENRFPYRDQLRQHGRLGERWLEVDFDDLRSFSEALASRLVSAPSTLMPLFERAATRVAEDELGALQTPGQLGRGGGGGRGAAEGDDEEPTGEQALDYQVLIKKQEPPISIRALLTQQLSQLVKIHGIVVSASRVQAKPVTIKIQCRNCGHQKDMAAGPGLWVPQLPRQCEGSQGARKKTGQDCPLDPYFFVPGACSCVDHQILKLQESPQSIPTGELPRTIVLSVDRALVGKAQPGSRISVIGLYTVMPGGTRMAKEKAGSSITRVPYVRVVGLTNESEGAGRASHLFKPSEEGEFIALSRQPSVYEVLTNSIAPAIFGHTDIKRAVLCQLFGGSVKFLPDAVKLRGDINVLLLGDPGTAKSQLLKFVEKVAPIGVYTSGKGSSAAGLTASVVRDSQTKEFYLEGGAMVLADGGVVCIDEFDKMNPNDRVAIHEAMEQQTISIAKAGITTILNSRTAVLAAANPVFGRYDEMRDASENIDFQTTILSRFDMIFLVRDRRDQEQDKAIAQHVMQIHFEDRGSVAPGTNLDITKLKRYIAYCRAKCAPRISEAASRKLEDFFVQVRDSTREQKGASTGKSSKIPITVRQLEAIIRVSESLAKMTLAPTANEQHVDEAIRLFNASTVDALNTGAITSGELMSPDMVNEIATAEGMLRRTIPVGSSAPEHQIIASFSKKGVSVGAVRRAIDAMVKRDELEFRRQRRFIFRKH